MRRKTGRAEVRASPRPLTSWDSRTAVLRHAREGLRCLDRRCARGGRRSLGNQGRASSAYARARACDGCLCALGSAWPYALLRCTDECSVGQSLSHGTGTNLVASAQTAQPEKSSALGADGAPSCAVASAYSHLSSLSVGTLWRYYLRQEPDAVILHVRIRGGGYGQP